jgi:hypothetical protein
MAEETEITVCSDAESERQSSTVLCYIQSMKESLCSTREQILNF